MMLTLFPNSSVPYDYNMVNVAQVYEQLGNKEKALEIVRTMEARTFDELEYYYKMTQNDRFTADMFEQDKYQAETCVYFSTELAKKQVMLNMQMH